MKFSKELQRELKEYCMWLDVVTDSHVKLWKDDGIGEFTFATFSIINGEWHMTTEPYQLHMNLEIVVCLLTVLGELTKYSVENGILDVPEYLI